MWLPCKTLPGGSCKAGSCKTLPGGLVGVLRARLWEQAQEGALFDGLRRWRRCRVPRSGASADMKTPKSRRVQSLPQLAAQALVKRDPQAEDRLLARGGSGQDNGLVGLAGHKRTTAGRAQGDDDRVGLPKGDHARTMARC
jgi:hypothetical protein